MQAAQDAAATTAKKSVSTSYFQSITELIRAPHRFYADFPEESGIREGLRFLVISALFYTTVSFTYFLGRSVPLGLAVIANEIVMPFFLAGLTYALGVMFFGKVTNYGRLFSMFAHASGTVLLIAWIPALNPFTELWKAVLMVLALSKGCGLGMAKSLVLVVLTMVVNLLFVWSALPVTYQIGQYLAG